MNIVHAQQCQCGAVSVAYENDAYLSMPADIFNTKFPGMKLFETIMSCCNYCSTNHWGVDLCGCGSGQKVGTCDNGLHECRNGIPAQSFDQVCYEHN